MGRVSPAFRASHGGVRAMELFTRRVTDMYANLRTAAQLRRAGVGASGS